MSVILKALIQKKKKFIGWHCFCYNLFQKKVYY